METRESCRSLSWKILQTAILVCLVTTISGCGATYTPKPPPIFYHRPVAYEKRMDISLVNAQHAGSVIALSAGSFTVKADLHNYTALLIRLIEQAWKQEGGTVSADSRHTVRVAVVDVWLIPRFAAFKCDVNLSVALGGNRPFGLEASSQSFSYEKAIDLSLSAAAAKVLTNQEVVSYLLD